MNKTSIWQKFRHMALRTPNGAILVSVICGGYALIVVAATISHPQQSYAFMWRVLAFALAMQLIVIAYSWIQTIYLSRCAQRLFREVARFDSALIFKSTQDLLTEDTFTTQEFIEELQKYSFGEIAHLEALRIRQLRKWIWLSWCEALLAIAISPLGIMTILTLLTVAKVGWRAMLDLVFHK